MRNTDLGSCIRATSPREEARTHHPPKQPTPRAGPAEFRQAFNFAYEAAGREPPAPQPAGGVLGGLARLFGGAADGGGEKRRPLEADLRALKSLDSTLLKLGAVYADAETRGR
jgi:hypothetical protein